MDLVQLPNAADKYHLDVSYSAGEAIIEIAIGKGKAVSGFAFTIFQKP